MREVKRREEEGEGGGREAFGFRAAKGCSACVRTAATKSLLASKPSSELKDPPFYSDSPSGFTEPA